jgi:hypothetical protein
LAAEARGKLPTRAKVSRLGELRCQSTVMAGRFRRVRLGMTQEQMLAQGVTLRDIRYWKKTGCIEFTKET